MNSILTLIQVLVEQLDAAIAGGFKKGKPVFSYYWTPTGLMGKVDFG